ncbi:MAG: hypothetical protein Devi2KO_28160 [Devosia indica]
MADPDCTVESFGDEIDEAVTVGRMDVHSWVAARQVRQHRREMRRAECKGQSDTQATGKIARGLERFPCRIDLSARSGGMLAKRDPGFGQRRAARGPGQKLDSKLRLKPEEAAANHRL